MDLNELKKLYPTIDAKQNGLMKVIGEQFIDGIRLDSRGKIMFNENKINPHCISVKEENVNMKLLKGDDIKADNKKQD